MEKVGGKNLILFEDNHLFIIRKNSSDIVQADQTGDESLLERIKKHIKVKENKPGNVFLGSVHRIDRPVSGVVIFGKTSKAVARLNKMFQNKTISKTYWAVVEKQPPQKVGYCEDFIQKNAKKNKSFVVSKPSKISKKAALKYEWVGNSDNYSFLKIYPTTGRHHQIRVQLSQLGCIIKGDVKYGARRANKDQSIHLHARSIKLTHPVRDNAMTVEAPVPENDALWNKFESLEGNKS